ncbi:16597_t:CDS:2, partial [Racocetra persica]
LQIIPTYLKNKVEIWYNNANQQQAFGYWDALNQANTTELTHCVQELSKTVDQYTMHLHELYCRLETNTNVYPEIEKVRKFTTGLRTELQIVVRPFGKNTWNGVVNRAKTCELTCYNTAIYIAPNLNNNIITPTPTSSNSVEIIIEALTKYIKNLEKKIEKKLKTTT